MWELTFNTGIQTSKVAGRIVVVEHHRGDSEMTDSDRGTQRDRDSAKLQTEERNVTIHVAVSVCALPTLLAYLSSSWGVVAVRAAAFYMFTQQSLPACKPVLTPEWVIMTFLFIGFIFIPVGLVTLRASHSVVEIVERYDIGCVPEPFRIDKVSYIQDDSIPKNCSLSFKVPKYMKAPIYIYYQLDNYYQNHRRYVKSRSDKQLLHGQNQHGISSCQPVEVNNDRPIIPCGLIAWSLFNDTFTFIRNRAELKVNRKNIAWKSDREHKFGKNLSDQEDLIVWMRTSALPSFRKLYGRIEKDLNVDDVVVVYLMNNYNTYSFGGKKKLVLSTTSWFGGKNDFLGLAYVFIGSSSVTIAIVFTLLHLLSPRH
ncbi:LEM3 (ligand-effect modulator 3) family protein/CDC50 family protein isoform 2 [Gossypium australe]|uniref:LEM3 (Ligand-effect modulator 3) family protein/CDC50 family protein isoform 2 n=1 Tax=Gossypium australe TaxID=47621 RepID=A0A5B6WCT2_9ROSI|nr:LEM3 (ligand-effect modulator 3) family protein/CDC50 family protein isoform 2 [Gossypium australe]